jgi:hypothetical protein
MSDQTSTFLDRKRQKISYVLGMVVATLVYVVSLLEPSIRGPKAWAIFLCGGFVVFVCVLKLRNLIHGVGWVFPRSGNMMLCVLAAEVWLHLWFSH